MWRWHRITPPSLMPCSAGMFRHACLSKGRACFLRNRALERLIAVLQTTRQSTAGPSYSSRICVIGWPSCREPMSRGRHTTRHARRGTSPSQECGISVLVSSLRRRASRRSWESLRRQEADGGLDTQMAMQVPASSSRMPCRCAMSIMTCFGAHLSRWRPWEAVLHLRRHRGRAALHAQRWPGRPSVRLQEHRSAGGRHASQLHTDSGCLASCVTGVKAVANMAG